MKGGYFLFNGRFHKEDEAVFTLADLSCRANGFSEAFRAEHNEVLFLEEVSRHLLATAESFDLDMDGLLDPDGRLLRKDVSRLLNKNKLYISAKIEVQIYPALNGTNILLHAEELERGYYPLREPGLLLSFYHDHLKGDQPIPSYASSSSLMELGARRKASGIQKPNMILLNRERNCIESIGGSFAFLNNRVVTFPSADSGGYRCAILNQVMKSVKDAGYSPVEKDKITMEELLDSEELFLFDACNGLQKVLGLEDNRYFSTNTPRIAAKLSELAKKDREERINN